MGVPPRTMYHLAETGQIPCRRLGEIVLLSVAFAERAPRGAPHAHVDDAPNDFSPRRSSTSAVRG